MKFDIRNLVVLSGMVLSSCSAPNPDASSTTGVVVAPRMSPPKTVIAASNTTATTPQANLRADEPVIVFQQIPALKALGLDHGPEVVLRDSFGQGLFKLFKAESWSVSPDGASVAFAAIPGDVDPFDAAGYRNYLFVAPFNSKQRVLLAAYGRRAVKQAYSFSDVSWSSDGKQVIVSQVVNGHYPQPGEVAIYDVNTRQEVWSSHRFVSLFPKPKPSIHISLFAPALSPDGNDLVCFARQESDDEGGINYSVGEKVPLTKMIHFDLKSNKAEVVATIDDQFSEGRYRTSNGSGPQYEQPARQLQPQVAWHPLQKKFVFVGPVSPKDASVNLFLFDLPSKKMTRFTRSKKNDISPQWSLDGRSVLWLRGTWGLDNQICGHIFRANADGSNPTEVRRKTYITPRIQLLPKIADWSRYRKLSIEPLAGKDK